MNLPLQTHRADRTWEHDIYFEMMRDDPEFNPNTLLPSLFWEIPFTSDELATLTDKVTDEKGAHVIAQHPAANYAVKARVLPYLNNATPETLE